MYVIFYLYVSLKNLVLLLCYVYLFNCRSPVAWQSVSVTMVSVHRSYFVKLVLINSSYYQTNRTTVKLRAGDRSTTYSILEHFGQRSQKISIRFPLHQSFSAFWNILSNKKWVKIKKVIEAIVCMQTMASIC